ncbi:hypothetical protein U9M48_012075 [Paspalum notatum var. saurae]|uniref:Uncharacterized protein n=1 Tax=Paspalum notatum var. saurae TaxID=547442 RepID=A0AAQ3SWQ8_PASNO
MALSSRPWRPARTACPRPDRCTPPPPALLRLAAVTSSGGLRPFSGRIRSLATAAPASASMAALPSTSAVAAGSRLSVAVMSRIRARVDTSAGLTTCPALLLVPFLRSVRLACRHRTSSHPVRFPDVLTPLCTSSRVRRCPVGATPLCPLRLRLPPFLLHPPRHALGSGRHQMRPLSSPGFHSI